MNQFPRSGLLFARSPSPKSDYPRRRAHRARSRLPPFASATRAFEETLKMLNETMNMCLR